MTLPAIFSSVTSAALSKAEIDFFIKGYVDGSIHDYQASALCMAIFFQGMNERETADLTLAMAHSGDTVDLSRFGDLTVDKHSTGGVGDKTTLIVAPIVSSLGCVMAKMSGRGLGHTGGTVDKLEAFDGFRTDLSVAEFEKIVNETGIAYYDSRQNAIVYLNTDLLEIQRIPLPDTVDKNILLSPNWDTVYFCSDDAIHALDLRDVSQGLFKRLLR